MAFLYDQKVLFKHCDPAGIVFYPRYFEMINDVTEAFFDQSLGCPFENLHVENGVPTAQISAQFKAPSRHGDHLLISLTPKRLGRSSVDLVFQATAGDELRFEVQSTLVFVNSEGRPQSWPNPLRTKFETLINEA